MKIRHLKEVTASALIASYLTLTDSSVVFTASGDQMRSKLTQAASTVQNILTGLVTLVRICMALLIIIKHMPDADDPQEKSEVYHAVGRVTGLIVLTMAVIWFLPWIYSLFT